MKKTKKVKKEKRKLKDYRVIVAITGSKTYFVKAFSLKHAQDGKWHGRDEVDSDVYSEEVCHVEEF